MRDRYEMDIKEREWQVVEWVDLFGDMETWRATVYTAIKYRAL